MLHEIVSWTAQVCYSIVDSATCSTITALIIATQNRYLEVAILLLDRNANRWAALSVAAKNGQVDVTRVLPDWKANASATDIQQQATLLMFVSKNGRVDLASPLLNPNVEVDVNLMNQWTVLMSSEFACENGHADVATLLLDVTQVWMASLTEQLHHKWLPLKMITSRGRRKCAS